METPAGRVELVEGRWQLTPPAPTVEALSALSDVVATHGGGPVRWAVSDPDPDTDAAAEASGLRHRRDLFQLRRPLPLSADEEEQAAAVTVRPFRPGTADEQAWLTVNNRAFASHPDQSGFDVDRLHARMAEPWFDADALLLHERDGRLLGSCWVKVHPAEPSHGEPERGEIYVVGVDPDAQGLGLGRGLTLAGLSWMGRHGLTVAMLYVDESNTAARALYERLGFERHHVDRLYEGHVDPA